MANAYIIHVFPRFQQYKVWVLQYLAQGRFHEKTWRIQCNFEPRTPGLRIEHFTSEPHITSKKQCEQTKNCWLSAFSSFRKVFFQDHWKSGGVILLTLYQQSRLLMTLWKKPFENVVGKGENVGKQHFPTMFSTLS